MTVCFGCGVRLKPKEKVRILINRQKRCICFACSFRGMLLHAGKYKER